MRGSIDFSPSSSSLIAFKPRQVLLLEQQHRNLAVSTPMAKNKAENAAQFKPEDDSILSFSVALWLENKGFSKVLKRFLSVAQIQDEEWKARALDLNEVFSKYQEICNSAREDLKLQKKQEEQVVDRAERIEDVNGSTYEEIQSKNKGKKCNANGTVIEIKRTLEGTTASEKMIESNGKGDPSHKTSCFIDKYQSYNASKESNGEKVSELAEDQPTKELKEKKKKKSKLIPQSLDADEKQINLVREVTQLNGDKVPELAGDQSTNKQKEKKKKKSQSTSQSLDANEKQIYVMSEVTESKHEDLLSKTSTAALLDGEISVDRKSKKRAFEVSEDGINESKKASKKRKRMSPDENENKSGEEVAVEDSKSKKSKGLEEGKDVLPQTALPGVNGTAGSQEKDGNVQAGQVGSLKFSAEQTDGITKGNDNSNGMGKSSQQKSASRQHKSSAEPKTVNAFQRVKVDEVEFVDERLQDNSYWAKDGAEIGYGAKAQEVLGQVKGRDFRHEKTKKKRGSYRGGQIDLHSHSIKFNYSDAE